MKTFFSSLLTLALLLTLIVVVLGAYTRLSDAGLGCPDWPGCYGHLTVPHPEQAANSGFERPLEPAKAWAEMTHRYAAGTLGILILAIFVLSLLFPRRVGQNAILPFLLICTVIAQAALGMFTVTLLLSPIIVTGHLIGGFTTLSLIWLLWLRQYSPQTNHFYYSELHQLRPLALLALLLVSIQIVLGGWTSTNYAAVACGISLPQCQGVWWPHMDFYQAFFFDWKIGVNYEFGVLDNPARTAIQMTHRIGAVLVFSYLLWFCIKAIRQRQVALGGLPYMVLLLLLVQVTLGSLNVLLALPLGIATAHNLVAALLLLSVIAVNYRLRQSR